MTHDRTAQILQEPVPEESADVGKNFCDKLDLQELEDVEQQLYGQVRQPSRGSLGDFRF
jgi:hypothetical protein